MAAGERADGKFDEKGLADVLTARRAVALSSFYGKSSVASPLDAALACDATHQTEEHSKPVGADKAGAVESNGLELRGMRALFPAAVKVENSSKKVKGFSALDVANLLISERNENCDLLDWSGLKKSPAVSIEESSGSDGNTWPVKPPDCKTSAALKPTVRRASHGQKAIFHKREINPKSNSSQSLGKRIHSSGTADLLSISCLTKPAPVPGQVRLSSTSARPAQDSRQFSSFAHGNVEFGENKQVTHNVRHRNTNSRLEARARTARAAAQRRSLAGKRKVSASPPRKSAKRRLDFDSAAVASVSEKKRTFPKGADRARAAVNRDAAKQRLSTSASVTSDGNPEERMKKNTSRSEDGDTGCSTPSATSDVPQVK